MSSGSGSCCRHHLSAIWSTVLAKWALRSRRVRRNWSVSSSLAHDIVDKLSFRHWVDIFRWRRCSGVTWDFILKRFATVIVLLFLWLLHNLICSIKLLRKSLSAVKRIIHIVTITLIVVSCKSIRTLLIALLILLSHHLAVLELLYVAFIIIDIDLYFWFKIFSLDTLSLSIVDLEKRTVDFVRLCLSYRVPILFDLIANAFFQCLEYICRVV